MRAWVLISLAACGQELVPSVPVFDAPRSVATRGSPGSMVAFGHQIFVASTTFSTVDRYSLAEQLVFSSSVAVGNGPRALAAGDLDGDTTFEVVTADTGGRSLTILSATAVRSSSIALDGEPVDVALADFSGDARAEIAVLTGLREEETRVRVLPDSPLTIEGATAFSPADMDGDGDLDLVVIQSPRASISVAQHRGAAWEMGDPIEVCSDPSAAILFEGSLAVACRSGGVDLLPLRNPRERAHYEGGGSIYDLTAGDYDGDGSRDLAGVDPFAHTLFIWPGVGGGLGAPITLSVSRGPIAIASVDHQEDGDLDLVVLAFEERRIDLLINSTPQRRKP